jgi:hypothetical protein
VQQMNKGLIRIFTFLALFCIAGAIRAQATQTFSYNNPVCRNGGTKSPVFGAGWMGGAGVFTSQSGLVINAFSGVINAFASAAGTYTVSFTGGSCGCTPTTTVQVVTAPVAAVSGNTVCVSSGATNVTVNAFTGPGFSYTWEPSGTNGLLFLSRQVQQIKH